MGNVSLLFCLNNLHFFFLESDSIGNMKAHGNKSDGFFSEKLITQKNV